MKKRLLCCLIASVFCLTAACSSQGGAANGGSQPKTAAEETVTQETAASADTSAASSAAEVSTAEESAAQAAAAAPGNVSADGYTGMYEDERGWYVLYDPTLFTVEEAEDDVKFQYTGEAVGENYVEIRYYPDKQPREVLTAELEELTEESEVDEEEIVREEAYFYEDKWCYTSSVEISEDDRDITVSYQSAEYNGGVLLTKLVEGVTDENILEGYMADALWYILDTIAFYDYQPQEEFYYVPGTYSKTAAAADHVVEDAEENTLSADEAFAQAPDQIILQNDHTGSFVTEEKAPIYWGSWQLTRKNTVDTYEYDVEGDNLYLNIGGNWIEYEKTGEAAADDGRLDNPEYLQELDQEIDILYNGGIGKTGRIRKMQAFILELALHAKTQNPDFAVIVQNAGYLAYNDGRFENGDQSYIKDLVDGWSTEGVVGKGDSLTPSVFQKIYIDQVKNNGDYFWVEDPTVLGIEDRIDAKRDVAKLTDAKNFLYNINGRPYDNWQDWDKEEEAFEKGEGDRTRIMDSYACGLLVPSENGKYTPVTDDEEETAAVIAEYGDKWDWWWREQGLDETKGRETWLEALRSSDYDVIYIDSFYNHRARPEEQTPLTAEEVESLKHKPDGGRRKVIAYLNIGSAEQNRWYCQDDWIWIDPKNKNSFYSMKAGKVIERATDIVYVPFADSPSAKEAGNTAEPPAWLAFDYGDDYPEEAIVQWWSKDWRDIIINGDSQYAHKVTGDNTSSLDRIMAQGFDGVFLDNAECCVDSFWEAFEKYWLEHGGIPE